MAQAQTEMERIAALETGQRQLGNDIHGLAGEFREFAAEIRGVLREHGRPQWQTILSALALAVTVGVLAFVPLVDGLNRIEEEQTYHQRTAGHPAMAERVDGLTAREETNKRALRREMALRDLALCERLAALEEKARNGVTGASTQVIVTARPCNAFGIE